MDIPSADIPKEWLYPPSLKEAARVQRILAERVVARDDLPPDCKRFGGADVSNNPYDPTNRIYAALVILEKEAIQEGVLPKPASRADVWRICETATRVETATLPYRPGFLGFREAPALVRAYRELHAKPDVLLVDGHGISHPRGLGIASHIGVLLDVPTIGVAKSILVGHPESEEALEPGFGVPLVWRGWQIGLALQTKRRSKPLYISVGHRVSLETAVRIVLQCLAGYRLPEPTRQAHLAANTCRRG
jgi:deoxyribonuclease V